MILGLNPVHESDFQSLGDSRFGLGSSKKWNRITSTVFFPEAAVRHPAEGCRPRPRAGCRLRAPDDPRRGCRCLAADLGDVLGYPRGSFRKITIW